MDFLVGALPAALAPAGSPASELWPWDDDEAVVTDTLLIRDPMGGPPSEVWVEGEIVIPAIFLLRTSASISVNASLLGHGVSEMIGPLRLVCNASAFDDASVFVCFAPALVLPWHVNLVRHCVDFTAVTTFSEHELGKETNS